MILKWNEENVRGKVESWMVKKKMRKMAESSSFLFIIIF